MKITYKVDGFREAEKVLVEELTKAAGRGVLRRAGTTALEPVAERMASLVRRDQGTLADSMRVQPARAKLARAIGVPRKEGVVLIAGPGPESKKDRSNAFWQEFGTIKMAAQSYARAAADLLGRSVIDSVRRSLTDEVKKSQKRMARRAARQTARLRRDLAKR